MDKDGIGYCALLALSKKDNKEKIIEKINTEDLEINNIEKISQVYSKEFRDVS